MSDTNTAREQLLGYCLAATSNEVTCRKAEELADAYRAEVLAEGARLLTSTSGARLDEIDEDDRDPSDWEQHQEWCDAAALLLAARTTSPQSAPEPDEWVRCSRPHCRSGERFRFAEERDWQAGPHQPLFLSSSDGFLGMVMPRKRPEPMLREQLIAGWTSALAPA